MTDDTAFYFQNYQEWRDAITNRCNIKLTPEYTQKRISALRNNQDPSTQEFISKYGSDYASQVIEWFERAANETP